MCLKIAKTPIGIVNSVGVTFVYAVWFSVFSVGFFVDFAVRY